METKEPLYNRIKADLERKVSDGTYKRGEYIPTEPELEAQYRVSRTTIRKAVGMLIDEGVLTIIRGKGTIVTLSQLSYKVSDLMSFTELLKQQGLRPSAVNVHIRAIRADLDTAEKLDISPGDNVVEIYRERTADEEPITVNCSCIPECFIRDCNFDVIRTKQSLYRVLLEECNIDIAVTDDTITAVKATREIARILHVSPGDPLLLIERIAYDKNGRKIEYSKIHIRGDRYQHTITLRKR